MVRPGQYQVGKSIEREVVVEVLFKPEVYVAEVGIKLASTIYQFLASLHPSYYINS